MAMSNRRPRPHCYTFKVLMRRRADMTWPLKRPIGVGDVVRIKEGEPRTGVVKRLEGERVFIGSRWLDVKDVKRIGALYGKALHKYE